jgi:hypothetical protein
MLSLADIARKMLRHQQADSIPQKAIAVFSDAHPHFVVRYGTVKPPVIP